MKTKLLGSSMLLLAALIWGSAFVAQSVGMDYVGPLTFNGARCIIGALVLIPVMPLFRDKSANKSKTWSTGILCGLILFVATNLQQFGIQYTSVGKAGFITTFYIVLVPLMGIVFFKRRIGVLTWFAVAMALCGLYLLCMVSGDISIAKGDILLFLCAIFYALHIMTIDRQAQWIDGVKVSCIQFAVTGVLSVILALIFEQPRMEPIAAAWQPLLFAGALSCGVAYTMQILGQKRIRPTVASLIMSTESVISVLAGWLLLKQQLSSRELIGCALMFCAIIAVQCVPSAKVDDC